MTSPFEPSAPTAYVTKVKQLLVGLPATDAEIATVTKDPMTLPDLVDGWIALPQFEGRMVDFFRNAFQQNNVSAGDVWNGAGEGTSFIGERTNSALIAQSARDSFAMTAWNVVAAGTPFNELVRTDTYMLTTAQMMLMSYMDDNYVDDSFTITPRLPVRDPLANVTVVLDIDSTNTIEQWLDSSNPATYMVLPNLTQKTATCVPSTFTFPSAGNKYATLFSAIFGEVRCNNPTMLPEPVMGNTTPSLLTPADYGDWHQVKIIPAAATDVTAPVFYDVLAMRKATTMTLHSPRVGFMGTLAFQGNWPTNASNEARVLANQSLIVAIGQSIDGANVQTSFPENSTDADHATDPACAGCHRQLDPFKQYFRQSWTLGNHEQLDPMQIMAPAGFSIDGVTTSGGSGLTTVTDILATHPRFATAWVQKLYFWATSRVADETDPEVQRIANAFVASNYNWRTLVRELFSSPLLTYASVTKTTAATGGLISIARRDQLCAALGNRVGVTDLCGEETAAPTSAQASFNAAAALISTDTYFRAFELPTLPTDPDLFFRASSELVCSLLATQLVTTDGVSGRYKTTDTTSAISDMVTSFAGLGSQDPRAAQINAILTKHEAAALATSGVNPVEALRSTVTLACQAPSSVIVGL